MVDYDYWCTTCRVAWSRNSEDPTFEYLMDPCPKCGTRTERYQTRGIPHCPKEYVPRYNNTFGCVVKSAREEERLRRENNMVAMSKSEWTKQVKEPAEHELWKQERGLPAFQSTVPMPSVEQVADSLNRVRMRLKYDDNYRKQYDPTHPGFKDANRGPEDRTP